MNRTEKPSFGVLLRRHRQAAGLTQEELAERAEVSGRELAAVAGLLREETVRLLTLTGPGGTGKTRLALRVADDLLDAFPDGIIFVPLASITEPSLVASTVAAALHVKEAPGQPLVEALQHDLRRKRLLLLLDNFEPVLPAAPLVSELLAACPHVRVMLTSRVILHLAAEHVYTVQPLAVPTPGDLPEPGGLAHYDAVALFVARARAAQAGFALTTENAPAVIEICRRLDGLPLAIELAATRIRMFPPQALLGRLEGRLNLLTGGAIDAPARQQTLRSAIDWSHDLLSEQERSLFAWLSVFAGGCTLEAVQAVCTAGEGRDVDLLNVLASLIDQNLLRHEGSAEPRFVMLETIQEYALDQLSQRGEERVSRDRHATYYCFLAEEAQRPDADHVASLQLLETEHANLRAALQWLYEREDLEAAYALATSLFSLWLDHAHYEEAGTWFDRLLARESEVSAALGAPV